MLINTYFPTDLRYGEFDETELLITLSDINMVMTNHDFDRLVWAGDINADFKRNTKFVKLISDFIFELDICKSWDKYEIDFTHAHKVNAILHVSTIDHFFWNSTATDSIIDAGVLHLSQNLSDHSPVFCKMETRVKSKQFSSCHDVNKNTKPCWKKATEIEKRSYYDDLHTKLENLTVTACVLNCSDAHCTDASHKMEIDDLMIEVW